MPRASSACKVKPCGLYTDTGRRRPPPNKHDESRSISQMHICSVECRGGRFVPACPPHGYATSNAANKFRTMQGHRRGTATTAAQQSTEMTEHRSGWLSVKHGLAASDIHLERAGVIVRFDDHLVFYRIGCTGWPSRRQQLTSRARGWWHCGTRATGVRLALTTHGIRHRWSRITSCAPCQWWGQLQLSISLSARACHAQTTT